MNTVNDKPIKGIAYANTHLQQLDKHLFAVAYIAGYLHAWFYPDKKNLTQTAFIAGSLHDIGKLDPGFQEWVTNPKNKSYEAEDGQHIDAATRFSFEKHPRHNEISALIYETLDSPTIKKLNRQNKKSLKHAVFWHHAKPFRKKENFEDYESIYKALDKNTKGKAWIQVIEKSVEVLDRVVKIDCEYRNTEVSLLTEVYEHSVDKDRLSDIEAKAVPKYKEYDDNSEDLSEYHKAARYNADNNEIRACLITADRWVSPLCAHELATALTERSLDNFVQSQLEQYIIPKSNLADEIDTCIKKFSNSERTQKQAEVAKKLSENSDYINVLAGAAGCGKTKIALEWAKLGCAQQILWICPRVQICLGLFAELTSDAYLPDTTIELHTGEFKYTSKYENATLERDYFTGDIVITTIDQILSTIISHSRADRLLNYLAAHIVFDEYHEYINIPAFNLLFAELLASRKGLTNGPRALLVSATPHYKYLKEVLQLDIDYDVVEMPNFNNSQYQFRFSRYDEDEVSKGNPLYQYQKPGSFIISNTAITAQKSFVKNQNDENAILLHSKYKKSDKRNLFLKVFDCFGSNGNRRYDILRSGPIIQASLNISCDYMISEVTSAENCLQRLGRLDRFGKNTQINEYIIAVPSTLHNGKNTGAVARFLSHTNGLESAKAWYRYLIEKSDNGQKVFSLIDIYDFYKAFYSSESSEISKAIASDLIKSMQKGVAVISKKIADPFVINPQKKTKKRKKISSNSLRGDNRFVQMAVCDVSCPGSPQVLNRYAYDIPTSEAVEIDNLTESMETLRQNGLLNYAAKKHGRIDETSIIKDIPANKERIRERLLESYARDPEYPIFVSYTPNELEQKLGEHSAHNEAIYYGICDKQPIGAISCKNFSDVNDEE